MQCLKRPPWDGEKMQENSGSIYYLRSLVDWICSIAVRPPYLEPSLSSYYRLLYGLVASHVTFQDNTNFLVYHPDVGDTAQFSPVLHCPLLWRCTLPIPASPICHDAQHTVQSLSSHWREISLTSLSYPWLSKDQNQHSKARSVGRRAGIHQLILSQSLFNQCKLRQNC